MSEYEPSVDDTSTDAEPNADDTAGMTIESHPSDGAAIYMTDTDGDGLADEVLVDADSDGNIDREAFRNSFTGNRVTIADVTVRDL